jgi:HTH-type transcriptional regulator, cell division transcriptional repressor
VTGDAAKREWCRRFGVRLRVRRDNLGVTQQDLARAVGVAPNTVYKWEAGLTPPDSYSLARVCEALGCRADDLVRL